MKEEKNIMDDQINEMSNLNKSSAPDKQDTLVDSEEAKKVRQDEKEMDEEIPFSFIRHVLEERNDEEEEKATDEPVDFSYKKHEVKKHPNRWIVFVIVAAFVLLIGTFLLLGLNDIYGLFSSEGDSVQIEITSGETVSEIADSLEENGVIGFSRLFKFYVTQKGTQASIYPGCYQLNENTDYDTILATFKDPTKNLNLTSFVIPEGWDLMDIANSLEQKSVCSADDFLEAINDPDIYHDYSFTKYLSNEEIQNHYYPMEGYVFPATYSISKGNTPEEIARTMLQTTDRKLSPILSEVEDSDYDLDEIMTLASIIEAEAGTKEDMPLISSVLHNRLNDATEYPKLESDPTIKYAQQLQQQGGASSSQALAYDTYVCTGFPAGPICNPGMEAIEAALSPADTDYLYFCANLQTKECYYATTLEEHNQNLVEAGLTK